MAKFNIKTESRQEATNLAGGRAYAESPELEFASLLLTSFVQDQFYGKESDTLERVSELLDKGVAPEFAAKAAVYARDQFNMRSISHVVGAELAYRVKNSEWMRPFIRKVVLRVDDMLEILKVNFGREQTVWESQVIDRGRASLESMKKTVKALLVKKITKEVTDGK